MIKIFFLLFLTRLLNMTESPFLCSGLYTAAVFLSYEFLARPPHSQVTILIATAIAFALSSVYFFLLNRFQEDLLWYYLILAGGLLIGIV